MCACVRLLSSSCRKICFLFPFPLCSLCWSETRYAFSHALKQAVTCATYLGEFSPSFSRLIILSVSLSVCLSVRLSVYLSFCLSLFLSVCLSVYLSLCLSLCLLVRLSCVSVFLLFTLARQATRTWMRRRRTTLCLWTPSRRCVCVCVCLCVCACMCPA